MARVCQMAWCSERALKDWQTGVIIPINKKGDRSECSLLIIGGISLLSLPRKVYAKCLEKRCIKTNEPKFCRFVDHEKACDWVPREKLRGVLRESGVDGCLLLAIKSL